MTQQSKDAKGSAGADLRHFVHAELPALSEAFAAGPLMQLRVSTPKGSVTLVKAAPRAAAVPSGDGAFDGRRGQRAPHEYIPDSEPGRAYDTVCADVVGVFHPAPDLPAPGGAITANRVLGYIEALKVRTPVRAGLEGRLVGQVAEEGQPVDFGEALFIVDSGPAEPAPPEETPAEAEPPRL